MVDPAINLKEISKESWEVSLFFLQLFFFLRNLTKKFCTIDQLRQTFFFTLSVLKVYWNNGSAIMAAP